MTLDHLVVEAVKSARECLTESFSPLCAGIEAQLFLDIIGAELARPARKGGRDIARTRFGYHTREIMDR